jgi:two-component system KDP operon response regulator KdpE
MNRTPGMARVLVVDDEPQTTGMLQTSLAAAGYDVQIADDGQSALHAYGRWRPDLIITELSMPRMGGIALCQALRAFSNVPIIVLSVKNQEMTKVQALEAGADDYLTKPFGMDELLARVKAALRRASSQRPETTLLEQGDFRINLDARRTEIRGKEVRLTPKEFELLTLLLHNAGKVLTHKSLLTEIWGKTYAEQPDAIRVLVRQLRRKIEPNPNLPKYLKTEPWVGYRFEPG